MEADALEADAFISFSYPAGSYASLGVAMEVGYNPKLMHLNIGPNWDNFPDMFGVEAIEGIMTPGAWSSRSSDNIAAFEKRLIKRLNKGDNPIPVDYWGHLPYYAGCQFLQKAIEKAGTLDHNRIRDIMSSETFDTTMGPVKFDNGMMIGYVGQMGQWQNGVYEVIGPDDNRTADPIYPKPEWPVVEQGTDADTDTGTDSAEPDAGE
jgi:branched-chain amino acid transport system substrate-binding protein